MDAILQLGDYRSGEIVGGEAAIRLEGARGATDIAVNLTTGAASVTVVPADFAEMLYDLHRGKNVGAAWSAVIDGTAIVLIVLSTIGFVFFLSLRMRLAASLQLTAGGLLMGAAIFYLFVP